MKKVISLLNIGLIVMIAFAMSCTKDKTVPVEEEVADPIPRSFVSDVQPIINEYCISCHSGQQPAAGRDYSTYEEVKDAAMNANMVGRINDPVNPMPAQGGLMPQEKRTVIEDWTLTGYGQ